MNQNNDIAKNSILELVTEHGPIGWYPLELKLRVPRDQFRSGYNMMNYLDDLIADGSVKKTDDGKFDKA